MKTKTIIKKNAEQLSDTYPYDSQKMQLVEEMGELLQALSKFERANGIGQPTEVTSEDAWNNLIEEFAGVSVMVLEMIHTLSIEKEVEDEMLSQTNRALSRCNS